MRQPTPLQIAEFLKSPMWHFLKAAVDRQRENHLSNLKNLRPSEDIDFQYAVAYLQGRISESEAMNAETLKAWMMELIKEQAHDRREH